MSCRAFPKQKKNNGKQLNKIMEYPIKQVQKRACFFRGVGRMAGERACYDIDFFSL